MAARDLAVLLGELKNRSGLSYAELAARTFTTRSTLHRYCNGACVPRDYAVVAALARECGATPEELLALSRLWSAAVAGASPGSPTPPTSPTASVGQREAASAGSGSA